MTAKRPLCAGFVALMLGMLSTRIGWLIDFALWFLFGVWICFDLAYPAWLKTRGIRFPVPEEMQRKIQRSAIICGVLVFCMLPLGACLQAFGTANRDWYTDCGFDGKCVTLTGTIVKRQIDAEYECFYLSSSVLKYQDNSYKTNHILIKADLAAAGCENIQIGNTVKVTGDVSLFSCARNPGNFDLQAYYQSKQIDFRVDATNIRLVSAHPNHYREMLYTLKKDLHAVYEQLLPEEDYGLLCTMVIGDSSSLDAETKELYQQAGLSHILCISGLHISLLAGALYRFFRRRGVGYWPSALFSGAWVISFGFLVGMGVATRRAIVMFLCMLIADVLGLSYDSLTSLAVAGIGLLVSDPLQLDAASFPLSFVAVCGAVVISPALHRFTRCKHRLYSAFLLCISIQVATLPLSLWYYYTFSTYSILLNVLLLPLVSVLLMFGLAGGFVGLVHYGIASVLLYPCHLILQWYRMMCCFFATLPYHRLVIGRPKIAWIVVYYVILVVALWGMGQVCALREKKECTPKAVEVVTLEDLRPPSIGLRLRKAMLFMAALLAVLFLWLFLWSVHPVRDLRITMLDVGQGEGILLQSPAGEVCFFDGGSTDVKGVGKYRMEQTLLYYGIGHVDYWFVSHTDADHYSGLQELIERGYAISYLVLAEGMVMDDTTQELIRLAQTHHTKVVLFAPGDTVSLKDGTLTCIFPKVENAFTDKNDACLVMELEYQETKTLFTGDLTQVGEEELVAEGKLSQIDVLMVGHHGSKTSSSEGFLDVVYPKIALISAGVDNSYGHPAPEVVSRLHQYTERIFCTQSSGAITLRFRNHTWHTETWFPMEDTGVSAISR